MIRGTECPVNFKIGYHQLYFIETENLLIKTSAEFFDNHFCLITKRMVLSFVQTY